MWVILAEIGIAIGLNLLARWLSDNPRTYAVDLTSKPSTREGDPICLVMGTDRVRQASLVWYGGFRHRDPIDFGSVEEVGGPRYGANMLFVVGLPMGPKAPVSPNVLLGMWFGDQKLDLNIVNTQAVRTAPHPFYGGPSTRVNKWGHIGYIQFFSGGTGQIISTNAPGDPTDLDDVTEVAHFIRKQYPGDVQRPQEIPHYRNQMLVSLTGQRGWLTGDDDQPDTDYWDAYYVGENSSVPPVSFEIKSRRIDTTGVSFYYAWWERLDADPAACLYDLLTMPFGRLNVDPTMINMANAKGGFRYASEILYGENNGYSRTIDSTRDAKVSLQEIVNQISGVLYQDPETGKYNLTLIRDDYDVDEIATFNHTHVEADSVEHTLGGWRDTINQVRVKYVERALQYKEAIAMAQNMASAVLNDAATDLGEAGGRVRVVSLDYPGVRTYANAKKIAARDLNLLSQPLAQLRVTFNRKRWEAAGGPTGDAKDLRPGDVFYLQLTEYHINGVYRITKVDRGQLGDNKVTIDAIMDPFWLGRAAANPEPQDTFVPITPPIVEKVLTEAPYWLERWVWLGGEINSPDIQRVWALARTPDTQAFEYSVYSQTGQVGLWQLDVVPHSLPITATVETAYSKDKHPYDNVTGLRLQNFQIGTPGIQTWSETSIQKYGYSLVLVGAEVIAYESVTDLGGGVIRLNNVWRGLLDTAPKDHPVGTRAYFVGTSFGGPNSVGRRIIDEDQTSNFQFFAKHAWGTFGSGEEHLFEYGPARRRTFLPLRAQDLTVSGPTGKRSVGTAPTPSETGHLVSLSRLDGAVEIYAAIRERTSPIITRGDYEDDDLVNAVSYVLFKDKIGGTPAGPIEYFDEGDQPLAPGWSQMLFGDIGHGQVDIRVVTRQQIGTGVIVDGSEVMRDIECWDPPTLRMYAPTWRNLLANANFSYGTTGGWTTSTTTVVNSTDSIPRTTSGFFLRSNVTSGGASADQIVDVSGYLPRGMRAVASWYEKNLNGDGDDSMSVLIQPKDASSVNVGGSTSTSNVPPTTNWFRRTLSITALPATTAKLQVSSNTLIITDPGTQGDGSITEWDLMVGQFTHDVLTNGNFDTNTASWTNVTNSMVGGVTTIRSPSAGYLTGGAFATSVINQDYALPSGYTGNGKAVLKFWRAQTIANDTGTVLVEVQDASNVTLASATTGAENISVLNEWSYRVLEVDVPENADHVRVTITAVRTGGAGNSGASFDDFVLAAHKELDPTWVREFDFTALTVTPIPATWQQWWYGLYADHQALSIPVPVVFGGDQASRQGLTNFPIVMDYNLNQTPAVGTPYGAFGDDRWDTTGYVFERQSGADGIDFRSLDPDESHMFANPAFTDAGFTCVVLFRVDEPGLATACGLVGRRSASRGWSLEINSSGALIGALLGASGTKSVTRTGSTVHDGAWHLAAVVYDSVADTLTVYDERGSDSVSTTSGLGEFKLTTLGSPFRIGRSRDTVDVLPGMISRAYYFSSALSSAQVAKHWNMLKDPNGYVTTYSRDKPCWFRTVPVNGEDRLVKAATDQIAMPYESVSGAVGLAIQKATFNLIQSFDFRDTTYWNKNASATLTQDIVDATGRATGCEVLSPNTTNGMEHKTIPVGASPAANINVQILARLPSGGGTHDLSVDLINSSGVIKQTLTVSLTESWTWKSLNFTAWDGSTAAATLRFRTDGTSFSFQLTSVMFLQLGAEVPLLWPDPFTNMSAVTAVATTTVPKMVNFEGEIIVDGVATKATVSNGAVVEISNGANNKNARELNTGAANTPKFVHYDSTPTINTSTGTGLTSWAVPWQLYGRWNVQKMLDNAANPYAGLIVDADVDSTTYGRTAAWTFDATANTRLRFGVSTVESTPLDCIIKTAKFRCRETKLA